MNIISYANPLDNQFHETKETFQDLKNWQKVAVVVASVIAGIVTPFILFTGAFMAFSWTVEYFDEKNRQNTSSIYEIGRQTLSSEEDSISIEEELILAPPQSEKSSTGPRVKGFVEKFAGYWDTEEKKFNDIPFDIEEVNGLLAENNEAFSSLITNEEENFGVIYKQDLPEDSKIFVRADLHGDLKSLLENLKELQAQGLLDKNYRCKPNVQLVFLGDYMDRGEHGMEILQILAALRLENPQQIHILRGNHEYIGTNSSYGFSDEHLQAMLQDEAKRQTLRKFYQTMPITVYLGQKGSSREYIQFTHALFEVQTDTAQILDTDSTFAQMDIPRNRNLSERVKAVTFDEEADYPVLIESATTKTDKQCLKLAYAAQRVHALAKMEDQSSRLTFDGEGTAYNWADVSEGSSFIHDLGNRQWQLSPEDIKHCFRLQSVKHKVKMIFRGHQHLFKHHCAKRDQVLVSTLPVGMDCAHYARYYDQPDRAYMLDVKPKVKNWTKRAITRHAGESVSAVSESVPIRAMAV